MSTYRRPDWLPEWVNINADGRLSWYDGGIKGAGTRRQKRCRTTEAAETEARRIVALAARSVGLSVSVGTTWADLCQAWTDAHDGRMPEGTFRRRLSVINAHIVPRIGTVPVAETSLASLMTVADGAVDAGVGRSTFDGVVQTMCVVADWGRERQYLPADPLGAYGDRRSALRRARRRLAADATRQVQQDGNEEGITLDRVPTWDDVTALADAVTDRIGGRARSRAIGERYGRAVRIAAGTGLRLCELLALNVDRVDLNAGVVIVDRQLDRYTAWNGTGKMPTTPPKYGRKRKALVWAKVRADLEAAIAEAGDDGVLFPPYDAQAWWADGWGRLLEAAREDASWTWPGHWLRHHYGSFSLAPRDAGGYGLPPAEVQASLGHRNLTTTLSTYIQPTRDVTGWVE